MVYIRTAYDGFEKDHSDAFSLDGFEPTLTQQNFIEECDINNIVAAAQRTGILGDPDRAAKIEYLDVFSVPDYQTSLNAVIAAQEAFDSLPAIARKRFHNSPAEFMEFMHDPDNLPEMIKLGLATPREESTERAHDTGAGDSSPPPAKGVKTTKSAKKTASDDAE